MLSIYVKPYDVKVAVILKRVVELSFPHSRQNPPQSESSARYKICMYREFTCSIVCFLFVSFWIGLKYKHV